MNNFNDDDDDEFWDNLIKLEKPFPEDDPIIAVDKEYKIIYPEMYKKDNGSDKIILRCTNESYVCVIQTSELLKLYGNIAEFFLDDSNKPKVN